MEETETTEEPVQETIEEQVEEQSEEQADGHYDGKRLLLVCRQNILRRKWFIPRPRGQRV